MASLASLTCFVATARADEAPAAHAAPSKEPAKDSPNDASKDATSSAQTPPTPSADATGTSITPPPPTRPAPAAQEEFVPDPAMIPTPHWYGWQTLLFDALAGVQAGLAVGLQVNPLYVTAAGTYLFGPIGVHIYHGRAGNIALSAAVRLGFPGLGAAGGWGYAEITAPSQESDTAIAWGAGAGCLAAALIDDIFIARENLAFWEKDASITVAPLTARHATGLSLVGTF